jgi:hypothetical protein
MHGSPCLALWNKGLYYIVIYRSGVLMQPRSTWVMGAILVMATSVAAQQPAATPPPGRGAAPPPSPQAIERAGQILADARKAMGGEKLTAIQSIIVTGRTQRVRGNNLVPIEFEMAIEVPDKFVRKDEVPAEESGPTATGFVGDELIQVGAPAGPGRGGAPAGRPGGPGAPSGPAAPGGRGPTPPTPEQVAAQNRARVITARQDFTRLSLGLLLNSLPVYPLTFAFAAQAAAPQGTADVLDVTGEGGFTARLFIHHETHLPIMVSWQAPPTSVILTTPGQPPPANVPPGAVLVPGPAAPAATATQEEKDAYTKTTNDLRRAAQARPVEQRLYYADYRNVDGVQLPFRIRRAIGTDTTEETTFDRFRLNTKIDPRKFATK